MSDNNQEFDEKRRKRKLPDPEGYDTIMKMLLPDYEIRPRKKKKTNDE